MDRPTLRDWVIRFNAEGVAGLRDRAKSGRPSRLDEGQLAAFKALVLRGPDPERDGVSSWRAKDLCRIVEARFGVTHSENGMLRLLHDLGLSWPKTRPIHPGVRSDTSKNRVFGLMEAGERADGGDALVEGAGGLSFSDSCCNFVRFAVEVRPVPAAFRTRRDGACW